MQRISTTCLLLLLQKLACGEGCLHLVFVSNKTEIAGGACEVLPEGLTVAELVVSRWHYHGHSWLFVPDLHRDSCMSAQAETSHHIVVVPPMLSVACVLTGVPCMALNSSQCALCTHQSLTDKKLVLQDMEEAAAKLSGSIDGSRQDKSQLLSDIVETEKQVGP